MLTLHIFKPLVLIKFNDNPELQILSKKINRLDITK